MGNDTTFTSERLESQIRQKVTPEGKEFFLGSPTDDVDVLRRDYEKLRIAYELRA